MLNRTTLNAADFAPCDHCHVEATLCASFDIARGDAGFHVAYACCDECGHPSKELARRPELHEAVIDRIVARVRDPTGPSESGGHA